MVGMTPNAKNHAGLGAQASRFVEVEALPWEPTRFPGIETRTLFVDKESGSVTALIRMAPGARLPDHEHPLSEQSFVLEGVLEDDDGSCTAGDFVWRPAGSRHQAWSSSGCVVLGIFQVPNRFFENGGRIADVLGQDWEAAWGRAANLRAGS